MIDTLARVKSSLAEGVAPEDIWVHADGQWRQAGSIIDPVLRALALRSLREIQYETTHATSTA